MNISFFVEESFEQIFNQIRQDNNIWKSVREEDGYDVIYWLFDTDYPDCRAKVTVWNEAQSTTTRAMSIQTAWSNYGYEIGTWGDPETCMVSYTGAYRGLLEQVLLPRLTPIDLLKSHVASSLGDWMRLEDYAVMQDKLHKFKQENELTHAAHVHPRCVYRFLNWTLY